MFDVAPTELLVVAIIALIVIGPKDLPKAMRFVGYWVGKARGVARQFRAGFDEMVREAELAELEKQWAAENERIMRQHPSPAPAISHQPDGDTSDAPDLVEPGKDTDLNDDPMDAPPLMTPKPHVKDDLSDDAASGADAPESDPPKSDVSTDRDKGSAA